MGSLDAEIEVTQEDLGVEIKRLKDRQRREEAKVHSIVVQLLEAQ